MSEKLQLLNKIKVSKNKISVGIFIGGDFIPSYAGATNRMHYLSRYLQRSGVKVVVFHGYRGWTDLQLIAQEPFKTYIFPINKYYNDLDVLANLIRKENIQIIQFNDLEPIISQGIKLSHSTGTYLISELHYVVSDLTKSLGASTGRINSIEKLENVVGKIVDYIICLSDGDKLKIEKKMKISSNKITAVSSGVDLQEIKYWGPNFNTKTILFLGNLYFEPNANAVESIYRNLFFKLQSNGFKFIIVGDCPAILKKKYEHQDFHFTGPVRDLNIIFKQTTIALAPIQENTGMSIKILNYLAAGLPVIATSNAVSGMNDIKNLIIENDIQKYVDIIHDLIINKKNTIELSIAARQFIEKDFDWLKIASRTISIYNKILSRPTRDKSKFINLISTLHLGQPTWLEEAERKGRFANLKSIIKGKFSYGIIQHGKIKIIKSDKSINKDQINIAKKFALQKFTQSKIENHFLEVYQILKDELDIKDQDVLIAGLLHDTLEDTSTTYKELEEIFSKRVADFVQEVSHPKNYTQKQRLDYYARIKYISPEAKFIKMADFISHLRNFIKIYRKGAQNLYPKFVNNDKYITQIREFLDTCEDSMRKKIVLKLTKKLENLL